MNNEGDCFEVNKKVIGGGVDWFRLGGRGNK